MKTNLSQRIRPNVEAAPWVIAAVIDLETQYLKLLKENERLRNVLKESLRSLGKPDVVDTESLQELKSVPARIRQQIDTFRGNFEKDRIQTREESNLQDPDLKRAIELLRKHEWVTDGRECATFCLHCHREWHTGGYEDNCEAFGVNGVARASIVIEDDSPYWK